MEIKIDNYIVVVISSDDCAEKKILACLGRNNDAVEAWCYAAFDSSSKILSKPKDNSIVASCNHNFFLINPDCLRVKEPDHAGCTKKIAGLLEYIKRKEKKLVCWLHNSDTITDNDIASFCNLNDCKPFSHTHSNETADTNGPEHFMFNVSEENLNEKFKTLIEYSLKKKPNPHLIALSILCQGYLAAHGEINLEGISIADEEKRLPDNPGWWTSAFLTKETSSVPLIYEEMKALEKNTSCVEKLFEAIQTNMTANIVSDALRSIQSQKSCA